MSWTKWKFVFKHAAFSGVLAAISMYLGANVVEQFLLGSLALYMGEYGELKGRAKERGGWSNNFRNNLKILIDAIDDKWQWFQVFVASVIGVGAVNLVAWIL